MSQPEKKMIGEVDLSKATKIYLGADQACRCGCKGSYAEKGTRAFDTRLRRMQRMSCETVGDLDDSYFNVSLENNRALAAYFD